MSTNPNASYAHRMRGCPGNYKQAADAAIAELEAEVTTLAAANAHLHTLIDDLREKALT